MSIHLPGDRDLPSSSPVSDYFQSFDSRPSSSTVETASASAPASASASFARPCPSHSSIAPGNVNLTPAAANIVDRLRSLLGGDEGKTEEERESTDWSRFPCTQNDWDTLQGYLATLAPSHQGQDEAGKGDGDDPLWGFYHDKVRLDAFCDKGFAVIRMASTRHELFLCHVVEYLHEEIKTIQARADAPTLSMEMRSIGQYAKRIRSCGSRVFHYIMPAEDGTQYEGNHHPDASFCISPVQEDSEEVEHDSADESLLSEPDDLDNLPIPGLIIEVSYSQPLKDLQALAEHYLLGTGGDDVKLVLVFDLIYRGRGARVFGYRRKIDMVDGEELLSVEKSQPQEFKSATGELVPGQVTLHLSDFGPEISLPLDHQKIILDFARLHSFLKKKIKVTPSKTTTAVLAQGERRTWGPGARKRPRDELSEDELSPGESEREDIQRDEEGAAQREMVEDPDWVLGSQV